MKNNAPMSLLNMRFPTTSAFIAAAAISTVIGLTAALADDTGGGQTVGNVRVTEDQLHQLDIQPAKTSTFAGTKAAIGQIAFNEDASTVVLTPFSGRVTRLLKRMGDDVKRGEPLFEIDSPEVAQAQTDFVSALQALEKSKSQLAMAKRSLDRQLALLNDKATSQRDADQAKNDFAAAESDGATAQNNVAAARNKLRVIFGRDGQEIARLERDRSVNPLITIDAPIDGTIVARKVGPGQFVRTDAGEALFSIADMSVMWLKAFVPESDIPFVRVGQELQVKVTALPDKTFTARVTGVGAASDQQTRRIVVRSEIENPDRLLKAEMFATFRFATGDPAPRPTVPVLSVIRNGEAASLWVEREPRVFERRDVKLGSESDGMVQIVAGLRAGERVVSRGAIFIDNEVK